LSDAYYDIVVVGTELTGLISAAMLAKKGYRVLVVGHGGQTNAFDHDGFPFVRRPWLFDGFETSAAIKKVFSELALSLEMHNRPKPFDPYYQVALPKHRIDVVAKESLVKREFKREFPDDTEQIDRFYKDIETVAAKLSESLESPTLLPPSGFMEKRAFRKLTSHLLNGNAQLADPLRSFPPNHPFRQFVLAPLLMSTGCHMDPYSTVQMIRATSHLRNGLFDINGGIDGLKRIFLDKVKDNCGDYREEVLVDHVKVKRGRLREIVLRNRREVIGCEAVLCNTDIKRFFNLIPQEDQKQRYHLKVLELQPTHYLYTINFALRKEAVPVGMGRHVFVVGDCNEPLENDNVLLLCVDPAGTPEPATNARVISVSARLNARQVRPTLDSIAGHDERIIARVAQTIPFFREHILSKATTWIAVDQRTSAPAIDTTEFTPILGPPLENSLETSPVACRTAYKNVFIAGDHMYAGLGFEGAFLGALSAVHFVSDTVSRKSLLRK